MKIKRIHIKSLLSLIGIFLIKVSAGQGRIVINEYMPWTLNGCGATSEFVELMNFGPGPMNIGCYILTDGDYSVTIPPNTVLQPGEFYVLAGQDIISSSCANIDSAIHADLNWNTCGCTNAPIPTTADGFFTDGGSANEQIVLLDPAMNVVDAVVRDLPVEPSSMIISADMGSCPIRKFDLDLMNITYETLGMSTGRGNSFARKLDGDCGWVKDPQQSGNATNNTPSEFSDVTYNLSIVKSMDCDSTHGSIDISVTVTGSYSGPLFPMNYTIALDANNDGVFDFSDTYTYGSDSTAPSISINGLPLGRYRITVGSVNGCFLQTFNVTILQCSSVLPVQLSSFKLLEKKSQALTFEWIMNHTEEINSVQLEGSMDGFAFTPVAILDHLHFSGVRTFTQILKGQYKFGYYRLHWKERSGQSFYSGVVMDTGDDLSAYKTWPNPVKELVNFQYPSTVDAKGRYELFAATGILSAEGILNTHAGNNVLQLQVKELPAGVYHLLIYNHSRTQPISFRFVKH